MNPKTRLTTRSLLACTVFGAASSVFVWLAMFLNTILTGTVAWLAYPAPTPLFLGALIAVLLIRKPWVATLTGLVTALIGFGTMALVASIFVELTFLCCKNLLQQRSGSIFTSNALAWSVIAGALGGAGIGTGIFMIAAARDTLPIELMLLGLAVKIAIGVVYGILGFYIARAVFRAGVNPQGLNATA